MLVAVGDELPSTGRIHCLAMEQGYMRIAVLEVIKPDALLMKPTEEAKTMGEARGSIIQWATDCLREQVRI